MLVATSATVTGCSKERSEPSGKRMTGMGKPQKRQSRNQGSGF
jgi:hypothetical protein